MHWDSVIEKQQIFANKEQTKIIVEKSYDTISKILKKSMRKAFPINEFESTYRKCDPYKMEKNPINVVESLLIVCVTVMT